MSPAGFVALALLALVLGAVAWAGVVGARRIFRSEGRLRLGEAVREQGLALPEPGAAAPAIGLALATRRCMTCAGQERCDELLAAADWDGLREICPNSAYIDSLRRG